MYNNGMQASMCELKINYSFLLGMLILPRNTNFFFEQYLRRKVKSMLLLCMFTKFIKKFPK